jgi:hypothetical protein
MRKRKFSPLHHQSAINQFVKEQEMLITKTFKVLLGDFQPMFILFNRDTKQSKYIVTVVQLVGFDDSQKDVVSDHLLPNMMKKNGRKKSDSNYNFAC